MPLPPFMRVPQRWRAAVCYAIPHIMYNVYSVLLQSPSMDFRCVFPCFFFLTNCEIVVLKNSFSGAFSRGFRDFSHIFPRPQHSAFYTFTDPFWGWGGRGI